jgi:hypothetical protein
MCPKNRSGRQRASGESSFQVRPHCRRVESSETALSYHQIGEIHGPQWGEYSGELLQLQGKRRCRLPCWLRRILDRDFGGDFPSEWRWIDHWGKSGETFIIEPYGLPDFDVEQIAEFCKVYGLRYHIGAESEHFPTRTVCVQIWPR